mgnify:CR=1 FL=1
MKERVKVVVTGAAGQISYSLIPRLVDGHTFGDKIVDLELVEIPQVVEKLEGLVMELEDSNFPNMGNVNYTSDFDSAAKDADWFLPEEHIDKDETLYETTGEVKLPLCSAILYLRVENLVGANLKLVRYNVEVTPKPGTLVLLSPGLLHSITDYESGKRISLNMNIWDSPPIIS